MTNDKPPKVEVQENLTPLIQARPSNPPETPILPQGGTNSARHAPDPMTLPESHQLALHHIRTLDAQNAKLYEDNCRLVNTVNLLNERLAFLGAPQNSQLLRLLDMQEKLRASEENRATINRKYQELLHTISAGPNSVHHHIYVELQSVRDTYASLDKEYRLLKDNYFGLKAMVDTSRLRQQSPSTSRGLVPVVPSHFHTHSQDGPSLSSTVTSPGPFQPPLDQRGDNRRRSSEAVVVQPSLRSGPTPVAMTWLAPLPTPPPSVSLSGGQASPTAFSVQATFPSGSLPLTHHTPRTYEPRILSGSPSVTQSKHLHLVERDVPEQLKAADHHREETADTSNIERVPCSKQFSTSMRLENQRPSKRPSCEQIFEIPGGERKKPRIEGEDVHSTTIEAYQATKIQPESQSPLASTDLHNDHKLSEHGLDARSYQDCVSIIFEKDANIENGVFCGLCFVRYQSKMIPEPPDVLVQPDFNSLVNHCMTLHPTVWDDLRHGRKA